MRIAVELENTAKSKARYEQLIRRWRVSDKVEWVLYVVTNEGLMKTILKCAEAEDCNRIKVMLLDELMQTDEPALRTAKGKTTWLVLRDPSESPRTSGRAERGLFKGGDDR